MPKPKMKLSPPQKRMLREVVLKGRRGYFVSGYIENSVCVLHSATARALLKRGLIKRVFQFTCPRESDRFKFVATEEGKAYVLKALPSSINLLPAQVEYLMLIAKTGDAGYNVSDDFPPVYALREHKLVEAVAAECIPRNTSLLRATPAGVAICVEVFGD